MWTIWLQAYKPFLEMLALIQVLPQDAIKGRQPGRFPSLLDALLQLAIAGLELSPLSRFGVVWWQRQRIVRIDRKNTPAGLVFQHLEFEMRKRGAAESDGIAGIVVFGGPHGLAERRDEQ